jgi:hypothetical protein
MQSLSGKESKNSWMRKVNVQEVKGKCPGQNAYDKEENIPIHLEEDKTKMIQTRTPPKRYGKGRYAE